MKPFLSFPLLLSLVLALVLVLGIVDPGGAIASESQPEPGLRSALDDLERGDVEGALDRLKTLRREKLPSSLQARVDLLEGILSAKQGRWQEAQAPLERSCLSFMELQDYSLYWLGRSLLEQGKPERAVRAFTRLLALPEPSRWKGPACLYLAEAYERKGDLPGAEVAYRRYLQDFPTSASSARARLGLARLAVRRGEKEKAASLLREIECRHPESGEAKEARSLRREFFSSLPLSGAERWRKAEALLSRGEYRKAADEFKQLAQDSWLSASEKIRASLQAGISLFRCRRYREALEWLSSVAGSEMASEAEEALFWLGRTHLRLGNRPEGRFHLLSLLCRFPQARRTDEALYILGQDEEAEEDFIQARDTYTRLIESFPASEYRERAIWRRGWASYRAGDFEAAEGDFNLLLRGHPESSEANQWLYWVGRCREKRGLMGEAAAAYESILRSNRFDYYYFRALSRHAGIEAFSPGPGIGKVGLPIFCPADYSPTPAASSFPPPTSSDWSHFLVRARELDALCLKEESLAEYGEVVRRCGGERDLVREACSVSLRLGRPDLALAWSRRNIPPNWPGTAEEGILELARFSYPLAYREILTEPEQVSWIDPYLILAVMREESAFSSTCISPAGARGLMQLMPSTAEQVARRSGKVSPKGRIDLFRPDLNLRLGAAYLKDLLGEFAGDPILSLASYNAGPEAVKRWMRRWPTLEQDEFVESIPYLETREYVKRVLRSYEVYRLLYQGTEEAQSMDHVVPYAS